ncbi:DEAD/DEAH box helicase [Eremococcus coleocola]|uniref:DEAD/DEAH box helicase n=1 Tax=Eremococcus coleocola TaxID=88132 RepID=UPI0003FB92AF|nr:DEAD/DEAH box helicase [Eremococcus coleocola]
MKFSDLNLKTELIETLDELGFEEPTPIQQQAIPFVLQGRDLVGQAQTGTGKTAAFGLPMLQGLDTDHRALQALIIAPTRELAIQVHDELYSLSKGLKTKVYAVYGGYSIGKQIDRIQKLKPQVIVGTPGRLLDLMRRQIIDTSYLKTLIMDEADEMLNMGFIEDIKAIVEQTPSSRQTLMFSATMPKSVQNLAQQFLTQPAEVKIEAKHLTADLIDQYFVKCRDSEKFDILTRMLDIESPDKAIIFARTKKRVDEIGRGLSLRGYDAELIHGDVTQQKRTQVMNEFKQGRLELLVATDVAARGIDVSGVTHVYNYDIPQDPESYVHRIGRTGRAGNEGQSVTFVMESELPYLRTIESLTKIQMTPMRPPTDQEAEASHVQQLIDRLNATIADGTVDPYRATAKLLLNHYESNALVAGLLNEVINNNTEIEVQISPQKPLPRAHKEEKGRSRGRRQFDGRQRKKNTDKFAKKEKSTKKYPKNKKTGKNSDKPAGKRRENANNANKSRHIRQDGSINTNSFKIRKKDK